MLNVLKAITTRELIAAYRNKGSWINGILFFIIISSIFPIILNHNPEILSKFAPIIIWLAFLLGLLFSLDAMFKQDFDIGTFEEYYLSKHPFSLLLLIKTSIHLLIILIPILVTLPLVLIAYNLNIAQIWVLFITIVLGSPAVVFIGSICASITAGLSRGGILLVILALPLYTPILILACASFLYFVDGHSIKAQLALLSASSIIAVLLAPFLSASVLKSGLQCGS